MEMYILDVIFIHAETGFIYKLSTSSLEFLRTNMSSISVDNVEGRQKVDVKVQQPWTNNSLSLLYLKSDTYAMCSSCDKPGIEIEIIKVILEQFNLTATFYERNYEQNKNLLEHYDILFGTLVIAFILPDLEITMPYIFDEAAFFIPLSFDIPRWKYILSAFPNQVWISWFCLTVTASSIWTITVKGNIEFYKFPTVFSSTVVYFIEQNLRLKTDLTSRKILLIGILILSFNMNLFFKGRLTYLLDGINHIDSAESLEEIIENELNVGISSHYIADLLNSTPEVRQYIEEHKVDCSTDKLPNCIKRAITEKDMVILYPVKKIRSNKNQFGDFSTGRPLLEQIKPSVASLPISLAFPKGHPSIKFFDDKLKLLREYGIVDRIVRKYEESLIGHESTFFKDSEALNVDHIVGPLFIWLLGCLLSLLVFLNEAGQIFVL